MSRGGKCTKRMLWHETVKQFKLWVLKKNSSVLHTDLFPPLFWYMFIKNRIFGASQGGQKGEMNPTLINWYTAPDQCWDDCVITLQTFGPLFQPAQIWRWCGVKVCAWGKLFLIATTCHWTWTHVSLPYAAFVWSTTHPNPCCTHISTFSQAGLENQSMCCHSRMHRILLLHLNFSRQFPSLWIMCQNIYQHQRKGWFLEVRLQHVAKEFKVNTSFSIYI